MQKERAPRAQDSVMFQLHRCNTNNSSARWARGRRERAKYIRDFCSLASGLLLVSLLCFFFFVVVVVAVDVRARARANGQAARLNLNLAKLKAIGLCNGPLWLCFCCCCCSRTCCGFSSLAREYIGERLGSDDAGLRSKAKRREGAEEFFEHRRRQTRVSVCALPGIE